MSVDSWEPGVYAINQRAGLPGSSILLEKIIVHNETFALLCQADSKAHFAGLEIRKDRKKIDYISRFGRRDDSVIMSFGKLPSPPLDLHLGSNKFFMDGHVGISGRRWRFHLKNCSAQTAGSEIVYRSIAVVSFFYPDNDEKKIYINRVITGQFTPRCSYTLIEGDFHEIEPEIFNFNDGRFLYLICRSGDDRERICSFWDEKYSNGLYSINSFIPPEYSIITCWLQTLEEASRSRSCCSNRILADPPPAPGEPFRLKSYAKSWLPWKNPKPATIYEAIRYQDLKAIQIFWSGNQCKKISEDLGTG